MLLCAWVLLVVAYAMSNPPGAASDEPDHYYKALGAGRGQLMGSQPTPGELAYLHTLPGLRYRLTRYYTVPGRLAGTEMGFAGAEGYPCFAFDAGVSAACGGTGEVGGGDVRAASSLGTYQPFLYPLAGAPMLLAPSPAAAYYTGRLAFALGAFLLIGFGLAAAQYRSGAAGLAGTLLAVSPMVVFTMSTLSVSALEVAGGFAWWLLMLRLARPDPVRGRHWLLLGITGGALALSRTLGPVWVLLVVAVVVARLGPRAAWGRLRGGGGAAAAAACVVAAACGVSLGWQVTVQPGVGQPLGDTLTAFAGAFALIPGQLAQMVGVFGWNDTTLPVWLPAAWLGLIAMLVATAWILGDRTERRALALAVVLALLLIPAGYALIAAPIARIEPGVSIQGRWLLAFSLGVPLLAGDVVAGHAGRLPRLARQALIGVLPATVFATQLVAFLVNGRRYAVGGSGPVDFPLRAAWSPPLGWWPWIVLALTGVVAGAAALHLGARPREVSDVVAA